MSGFPNPLLRQHRGPALPCHRSRCDRCGSSVALELHRGVIEEHCAGCTRNRQRADMGLPPITYFTAPPPEHPMMGKKPKRPRTAAQTQISRLREKLPTSADRACHAAALAASIGTTLQYAVDALHLLEARGQAAAVEGAHPRQTKRRSLLWYRPDVEAA